jgi:phage shock protein PspC (stress-responsive transcriptional regulator)
MQPPSGQKFHRGSERIVGGVCSGLAEGLHVDVMWVRLAFVLLAFLQGIGALLHVVLWVVVPEPAGSKAASRSGFDSVTADMKNAWAGVRSVFGVRSRSARPVQRPAIRLRVRVAHSRRRQHRVVNPPAPQRRTNRSFSASPWCWSAW